MFKSLMAGWHCLHGFTNRDIRSQLRDTRWVHNACTPKMEIDAQTYVVRADGELLTCDPATVLPAAQRYFLF